ncbi:MAG: DUF3592 domain-containing protein [Burkholderiales bacterium]
MANTLQSGLILLAAGAAGTFLFGRPVVRTWSSRRWPHVDGTVTGTAVDEIAPRRAGGQRTYQLRIRYRYAVGGKTYDGHRFSFTSDGPAHKMNQFIVEERRNYPNGKRVDVHYDPADPSNAVIDTGIAWWRGAAAGFSVFFLLAALVGVTRMLLGNL